MSQEYTKGHASELTSEQVVDTMTSFWDRFGRVVLGVVVAAVAIGAIAYFTIQNNERRNNAAAEKLAEANALFWNGDYERSKTTAEEVIKQYGTTANGNDARRVAGDAAYWKGQWKDAIAQYKAYLGKQSTGIVAQSVRRSLAYAYESDKQYAEAVKLYDQLVGVFERESSGEMLAASARCLEAQNNKAEAAKRLQRLVDEFGDSSYANRARVKLAELTAAAN
ncbi:MAG: tetratricopeptide repeat protein [Candidatus Eisenbacteria bacterium]